MTFVAVVFCVSLPLMQFYDCDASSAKLHVFVAAACYGGIGLQVLADEGAQDAIARAVQYAHSGHAEQHGIVDVVGHGLQGLFASHATHVDVLLEVQAALRDILLCLLAQEGVGTWSLCLLLACSLLCRELQLGKFGHGAHHAEGHSNIHTIDLLNGTDGLLALDAYERTHRKRGLPPAPPEEG